MYEVESLDSSLQLHLLDEVVAPRSGDAPRHVLPSKDGKLLYSVSKCCKYIHQAAEQVFGLLQVTEHCWFTLILFANATTLH